MGVRHAPAGHKTRDGIWWPVAGHESTGYTARLTVSSDDRCTKCNERLIAEHEFGMIIYSGDDWALWCMTCFTSWAHVNEVLIYTSNRVIELNGGR